MIISDIFLLEYTSYYFYCRITPSMDDVGTDADEYSCFKDYETITAFTEQCTNNEQLMAVCLNYQLELVR